jgi:hypothetical protein
MMALPPGTIPIRKPKTVPLKMGPIDLFQSSLLGK